MSTYHVARVNPANHERHDAFDARPEFLMDLVLELQEMLEYPEDHDAVPVRAAVEALPSFDMESWLYLSSPDWKQARGVSRCTGDAVRRYADSMQAVDAFVTAEHREQWDRWKTVFIAARDHGHDVQLACD